MAIIHQTRVARVNALIDADRTLIVTYESRAYFFRRRMWSVPWEEITANYHLWTAPTLPCRTVLARIMDYNRRWPARRGLTPTGGRAV